VARFADTQKYVVSEASVDRLIKAQNLTTSSAFFIIKAADGSKDKTTSITQRRVEGAPPARSDRLVIGRAGGVLSARRMVLFLHDPRRCDEASLRDDDSGIPS
jgi:hypothetical protein